MMKAVREGNYYDVIIVSLMGLSFILSDWLISFFTVSDILMLFVIVLILFRGLSLDNIDKTSFYIIEGYLIIHILLNAFFNTDFNIKIASTNFVKILYYHIFILLAYGYVNRNKLRTLFLKVLNIAAVMSIFIGLYITIVIVFELDLPYQFIWFLTRDDMFSYTLRGTRTIIRTRSIFSEPAHLGYFLNIVLSMNLFTKRPFKWIKYYNVLLIIGAIATLSYSSIGVLLIILSVYLISIVGKVKFSFMKSLILVVIIMTTMFIFRDFLYEAIYIRTFDILSGEDGSVMIRLFNSWNYIDSENILLGNGLGHTPPIQNIYAYFLSDLGIIPFVSSIIFTMLILKINYGAGITFLVLNFSKGGYLSPIFNLYLLSLLILVIKAPGSHLYKDPDIASLE